MPNFLSVDNQYAIGAVSENFPVMTKPGFAFYEIPTRETYGGLTRFDDYRDGGIISLTQLSRANKGIILSPVASADPFYPLDRMNPADFTITAGNWMEGYPPNIIQQAGVVSTGGSCLLCYDQTVYGGLSPCSVSYNGALVACPYIDLKIARNLMPPYGMALSAQLWQFSFGDGYRLEFSYAPDLYLYYNNAVIGHHYIQGNDSQIEFATSPLLEFRIQNFFGSLHIQGNHLHEMWKVPFVGMLPAAPYSYYSAGGIQAFNVTQAKYPTAGSVITDPIQLWQEYDDEALVAATFPPNELQPPGCSATLDVFDSPDTTTKRFQLDLTGDGFHTPTVQAMQWQFPPSYTVPPKRWFDFTEWVIDATVELSTEQTTLSRIGPVMRQATLQVRPEIVANGMTLWEWLGFNPAGDYAIQIKTGMAYDDDTFAQSPRVTGMLTVNAGAFPVGGVPTKTWTVHDRWERLAKTALLWAPSVAGLTVDQAISTIAQWAGVAPSQIIADSIPYTLTEPAGDPTKLFGDWTQPTWYPHNGTNAAEFIKQIAERYGVLVAFDGAGMLEIKAGINTTSVLTFSRDAGTLPYAAVENVEEQEDRQSCINTVIVQGRDQYGRPIFAVMYDTDSLSTPGTPLYVGYPVPEIIVDENLTTQAAVNYACAQHYWARKAGYPRRSFPSHTNSGWLVLPNQIITLINSAAGHGGTEVVRITHVSEHYPGHLRSYTVTLAGEVLVTD